MPMLTPADTPMASGSMFRRDILAGLQWLAQQAERSGLQLYLVGGSIRDCLLQRPCADVDLVCTQSPTEIAKKLARALGGHWFWLDRERGYSRVVANIHRNNRQQPAQFDFSPLRAADLEADLALRDYTINAMAVDLNQFSSGPEPASRPFTDAIIDPLNGQGHLRRHELHLCSATVLRDDPLRIVKGLRHCATLGMRLSAPGIQACVSALPGLQDIAPERIRSEIAQMFTATNPQHLCYALNMLRTCAIDSALHLPLMEPDATAPAVSSGFASLDLIARSSAYLNLRLNWSAGDEFSHRSLGLFGLCLRAALPPDNPAFNPATLLKLSHKGCTWLNWLLNCSDAIMAQLHMNGGQRHPRRALQHLAHLGAPLPHGLAALTFFCRHADDVNLVAQLWHVTGVCLHQGRIKPLLSGTSISTAYPQLEGKALGMCLQQMAAAERQGGIVTSTDAWSWLEHYVQHLPLYTKGHRE